MITVADILQDKGDEIFSVTVKASVMDALELMAEKNIGAVLVMDDSGKLTGIVSERDIARAVLRAGDGLSGKPVSEFMTKGVKMIPETLSMPEVMAFMTHNRFRHLPVSHEGKLVGIISIGDVVKAEIHEQEIVIDQLEHYISGSL